MDDLPLSLERAADLLGLGPDASSEARGRLYEKKRILLEKRLRQAPTPGLRTRYRHTLDELTRAFEMVELASTERALDHLEPPPGEPVSMAASEPSVAEPETREWVPRAVVAGHVLAPSAFGLAGPGAPGRPRLRVDLLIIPLALIALLIAGGIWWWSAREAKAEADRLAELARLETARIVAENETAERARQQERLRLEAEVEARRREADRQAGERRVALDRQARLRIAEVDTYFETAARRLAAIETTLGELKSAERDLAAGGGWALEWTRLRWSLLDEHRRWLDDFLAQHPARVKARSAARLLEAADPEGGARDAQAAAEIWTAQAEENRGRHYRKVGRPLIEAVLGGHDWPPEALLQVKQDEPEAVARYIDELRTALAYLDDPGAKPAPADWRGRMQPLALLAGTEDADFKRWQPRFIGRLTVRSEPAGAQLFDEAGRDLGTAPREFDLVRGGTLRLTARLPGHLPATLAATVGLEENQLVQVRLDEIPVPKPGQAFNIPELGLVLQWIRPGSFTLGSPPDELGRVPDEGPLMRVAISQGFWLGRHEVTQGQWTTLMGRNPSAFKELGADAPVEMVSWKDAMEFGRKLTERERAAGRLPAGYVYTLPTEAQWEYACRAGSNLPYAGELESMAWYGAKASGGSTHPVGKKAANAWGLFDMHGNVWEWCRDWYAEAYLPGVDGQPVADPLGPPAGAYRVNRGGSWRSSADTCRSAFRHWLAPNDRGNGLGFRLALVRETPN